MEDEGDSEGPKKIGFWVKFFSGFGVFTIITSIGAVLVVLDKSASINDRQQEIRKEQDADVAKMAVEKEKTVDNEKQQNQRLDEIESRDKKIERELRKHCLQHRDRGQRQRDCSGI